MGASSDAGPFNPAYSLAGPFNPAYSLAGPFNPAYSLRDRIGIACQSPLHRETIARLLWLGERMANLARLGRAMLHEVRGPLQTILVALESLRQAESFSAPSSLRRVELAAEEVERLSTLLDALYDFVRTQETERRVEDVNEILQGILRLVAKDFRKAGIEVRADLGRIRACAIDREGLHLALIALIDNARDAMAEGGGTLDVRTGPRGDGSIEIRIDDTGGGMTPDVLERAFEPFFTTKPPGVGTGLGLWLSRAIVEAQGGGIEIDSAPGRGTSVRLWLPAAGGLAAKGMDGHVGP